jgi:hypothetical protein
MCCGDLTPGSGSSYVFGFLLRATLAGSEGLSANLDRCGEVPIMRWTGLVNYVTGCTETVESSQFLQARLPIKARAKF